MFPSPDLCKRILRILSDNPPWNDLLRLKTLLFLSTGFLAEGTNPPEMHDGEDISLFRNDSFSVPDRLP